MGKFQNNISLQQELLKIKVAQGKPSVKKVEQELSTSIIMIFDFEKNIAQAIAHRLHFS